MLVPTIASMSLYNLSVECEVTARVKCRRLLMEISIAFILKFPVKKPSQEQSTMFRLPLVLPLIRLPFDEEMVVTGQTGNMWV